MPIYQTYYLNLP